MTPARTTFADWPAIRARLLLAGLAVLILVGLLAAQAPEPAGVYSADPHRTDQALYGAVIARMETGEGYYPAAVAEHRARHYPLRPFVTVRAPWLARLEAGIGLPAASLLLRGLVVATLVAFGSRLGRALPSPATRVAGVLLATGAIGFSAMPAFTMWHEAWAGLLIALSLACRSERRWAASVLLGLGAALIRELALPYLLVMLAFALRDGRKRDSCQREGLHWKGFHRESFHWEAWAWAGAVLLVASALGWHAACLDPLVSALDPASPGWVAGGGWGLVLRMLDSSTVLGTLPLPLIAGLAPLALLGWAAWPGPTGQRGAVLLAGFALAFTVIGRASNVYWGMLLGPLLPIGLVWAPFALADLARAARAAPLPTLASAG